MRVLLLAIVLVGGVTLYALRPVCVAIPIETVAGFDPPISSRSDRDFYLTVFQLRDGQWHQCKTWISRQFFF
jgi:hypothetical protein